ncbi:hypothetical protein AB0K09_14795 [Streptomyces sp. NPDC049577]|uniref:hypothetical protein n=1 Tax=Streptomyces sp. NPDC049577 TaxID=3155153 RepID=UPI00342F9B3E
MSAGWRELTCLPASMNNVKLGDRFTRMSRDVRDVPEQDVTVDVAIRDGMIEPELVVS